VIRIINQDNKKTKTQVAMICCTAERLGPNHFTKNECTVSLNILKYLAHLSPCKNQQKARESPTNMRKVSHIIARKTAQTQQ
jgi:hypothetical protein